MRLKAHIFRFFKKSSSLLFWHHVQQFKLLGAT